MRVAALGLIVCGVCLAKEQGQTLEQRFERIWALLDVLDHGTDSARIKALGELGRLGPEAVIAWDAVYTMRFEHPPDPDSRLQDAVGRAFGAIHRGREHWHPGTGRKRRGPTPEQSLVAYLGRHGVLDPERLPENLAPRALPHLLGQLKSSDLEDRLRAVSNLLIFMSCYARQESARLGNWPGIPPAIPVGPVALEMRTEVVEAMRAALADPSRYVRAHAAAILVGWALHLAVAGKQQDVAADHAVVRECAPALVACLRDVDPEVRHLAALALWHVPRPAGALPHLVERLQDEKRRVRIASLVAIDQQFGKDGLHAVRKLVDDEDETVRNMARAFVFKHGRERN